MADTINLLVFIISHLFTLAFGYLVFRVFVRRDYATKGKLSAASTILEFVIFALHANLAYTFLEAQWPDIPPLPASKLQVWFGLGLIVLGAGLTLWAMSGLGFKKAVGQQTEGLNRAGFYQYARNPQLVFYSLLLLGIVILWPSVYALGWYILFLVIAQMMVKTEEEHLLRLFGEDYQRYCRQVPRYLPRLR